jgi:zinc/manganese transport system permease protein
MSAVLAAVGGVPPIFSHPFMRNAFVAGTGIAACCGAVGYFVVLRGQVFTGDALSHVAFTGALAALAVGADLRLGLFGATVVVAVGMGFLGRSGRADDVVIGSVFAWMLGLGVLFLSIYTSSRSGANGTAGVSVLFGSILGLSAGESHTAAAIGIAVVAVVLLVGRPLLFASLDEAVAAAAGVPVRWLGIGFLALVGLTAAETTQAVGALMLLGLLAAPAAAAHRLTSRPFVGLGLSIALAVGAMWAGLTFSYAFPSMPPSFAIIAMAVVVFAAASAWRGRVALGLALRGGANRSPAGAHEESHA